MKIGIYTIHASYNFGAMLQAYATQYTLEKMGYEVEFVHLYTKKQEKANNYKLLSFNLKRLRRYLFAMFNLNYLEKFKKFDDFHKTLKLSKRYFTLDEFYANPPDYDIHLVGSDQVWNLQKGFQQRAFYFLDFVGDNKIKVSYASSFGAEKVSSEYYSELKRLLSSFNALSCREIDGIHIIKEATGISAKHVLDPTLLIQSANWLNISRDYTVPFEKFILVYALTNSEESIELVKKIRATYKLPVVGVPMGLKVPGEFKVDFEARDAGPKEFISLFSKCSFVCTSSFHGVAFAINFEKEFYVISHKSRNSRLHSLLTVLDIKGRQFSSVQDVLQPNLFDDRLDYPEIRLKLQKEREVSLDYLQSALNN